MSDSNAEKDFYRQMIAERNEDIGRLNQKMIDLNLELSEIKNLIEAYDADRNFWLKKLEEAEQAPNQE